ncbi:cathepsin L1-like [Galendromus occidentalis]|uniref:Cathepsin L1-like n=1 Tax=Galendromus occidentalis TaxID=34638 RepID=A0AAJ6VVP3_9ACAR|nr:cathepsin L1-like [Galendromus occidentalis]
MFRGTAILLTLCCLSSADWTSYKREFYKNYSPDEDAFRRQIYEQSVREMNEHNVLYEQNRTSWRQGLTVFSDMTEEERSGITGSLRGMGNFSASSFGTFPPIFHKGRPPASVDWRKSKCVAPPKNQYGPGDCRRTCWAFATTGVLEYYYCKKHGKLESFSEKYLVDCVFTVQGCQGGLFEKAMDHLFWTMNIPSEKSYPYTTFFGECREPGNDLFDLSDVKGFERLHGDEELLKAVAFRGPVVAYMLTEGANLGTFRPTSEDDIFRADSCASTQQGRFDHAVVVVGYGSNQNGKYWIVKNSWGTNWGQNGYFKLSRDGGNYCNISDFVFVPKYR